MNQTIAQINEPDVQPGADISLQTDPQNSQDAARLPLTEIGATMRLQFHENFTFDHAIRQIDYFFALGITHIYSSPILTARKKSTHGYDIVDPTQISMELGGESGLRRFVAALRAKGMGLIIDIVPNHMGVGGNDNPWWQHVFAWGRFSPYAFWFDIDWNSCDPELNNKILAPFLGEPYGAVLEKGEIKLIFNETQGQIEAEYFNDRFPIAMCNYAEILRRTDDPLLRPAITLLDQIAFEQPFNTIKAQVEQVFASLKSLSTTAAGQQALVTALGYYSAGTAAANEALHELLEKQHYRLTWWRNAADEINWRRFFEVSELAGVRVELDEVFDATHSLIFELYEQGLIDGVRLDHIDGLAHPAEYCLKLRQQLEMRIWQRPAQLQQRPYIIAEKILAQHEWLRESWGLNGTTGYEFMDQVSAVLHDPRGEEPLTAFWQQITGDPFDFSRHVQRARRQLLSENLVGEFDATAAALHKIARAQLQSRDYSVAAIKRVLAELLVHFPVYRTYVEAAGPDSVDAEVFQSTAAQARRTMSNVDKPLVDIVLGWLSAMLVIESPGSTVADFSRRAMTRFQQITPPLLAKSVEDTAFYRYGRLLSRNEVGSDPGVFALPKDAFHEICATRQQYYPQTMLATATHDHKRGEDARARIAVISQIPQRWQEQVNQWFQINARLHSDVSTEDNPAVTYNAPIPAHELMLYQMMVGAWPYDLAPTDADGMHAFAERLSGWQLKSIREAKRMSNWVQANEGYEHACAQFLLNMMDVVDNATFLQSAYAFVQEIAAAGAINSLSQTLLRLTTPGIPDLYQGTELWDFSLVDPDNRRPVDYDLRIRLNAVAGVNVEAGLDTVTGFTEKVTSWQTGAIKQHLIRAALQLRQQQAALFKLGSYVALNVEGPRAAHIIAFSRSYQGKTIVVIVQRFTQAFTENAKALTQNAGEGNSILLSPKPWEQTMVLLPEANGEMMNGEAKEVISGQKLPVYAGRIEIAKAFSMAPFALLLLD